LFSVRTPTATITDLGTEFGVEVLASGETASHVFAGRVVVRTEGAGGEGRETGDENNKSEIRNHQSEIILSAGQSARVERGEGNSPKIVASDKTSVAGFVTRLPRRVPIKLFNTGMGLREGDEDPHWWVVARSDAPDFQPRPAIVTSVAREPVRLLPNIPYRSQWISLSKYLAEEPNDVTFTFRTTFNLGDELPQRVVLRGRFLADNCVGELRLNGEKISLPVQNIEAPFASFYTFAIERGLRSGMNVLEFDVINGAGNLSDKEAGKTTSPMLLRVELEGLILSSNSTNMLTRPE
jgi:hypothetical protein